MNLLLIASNYQYVIVTLHSVPVLSYPPLRDGATSPITASITVNLPCYFYQIPASNYKENKAYHAVFCDIAAHLEFVIYLIFTLAVFLNKMHEFWESVPVHLPVDHLTSLTSPHRSYSFILCI